jgi:hypothetical protein
VCKWGDTAQVPVTIQAHLSCTGEERKKVAKIDRCIAPIVEALEQGGIMMLASCCGHGKAVGHIHLADGRVLEITRGLNA